MKHFLTSGLLSLVGVWLFCGSVALAQSPVLGDYELVDKQRLSFTEFQYTYRVKLTNPGDRPLKNAAAVLSTSAEGVTVVDNSVSFGDVPAGGVAGSVNTFSVKYNRSTGSLDLAQLVWAVHSLVGVTYKDSRGNEVVVYISDVYNPAEVIITEGVVPAETSDNFPFVTNKFVEVRFPESYRERTAIQVKYSEVPERVLVFDDETGIPALAAFSNSTPGMVEVRTSPSNGRIVFALTKEFLP